MKCYEGYFYFLFLFTYFNKPTSNATNSMFAVFKAFTEDYVLFLRVNYRDTWKQHNMKTKLLFHVKLKYVLINMS